MKLSKPKYIFVTGGVASSLGKGIISASVARLLQARGYSVTIQKLDPTRHSYDIRHKDKVDSLLGRWWMALMHRINEYTMRLRTGRVNSYITFALVFLATVLVLTLLGIM